MTLSFVRLFQTSTPLTSVELSKKCRNSGFHGQGWTWLRTQCMRIAAGSSSTNAAYCKEVFKNKKAAWTLCIVIGLFALLWCPSVIMGQYDR